METGVLEKCFIYADANAHYIPIIGTVLAIVGLFEKYVVLPSVSRETIVKSYYFSYLNNKSLDAFLFASVPILGSIVIYLYGKNIDYTKNQRALLQAVREDARFLQHADPTLARDYNCMLAAIEINPNAINYIDKSLKRDFQFMSDAIRKNFSHIEQADPLLRRSSDFMIRALIVGHYRDEYVLDYADTDLKKDPRFMLEALGYTDKAIDYADANLKKNPEFMLAAMSKNFLHIEQADSSLKSNSFFIIEALKKGRRNGKCALDYADADLKKDPKFMLEALGCTDRAIDYADECLKGDKGFLLKALKLSPQVFKYLNDLDGNLKKDPIFMLKALRINPGTIVLADKPLKEDKKFLLKALKVSPQVFKYLNDLDGNLKKDPIFMLKALEITPGTIMLADECLKGDKEFLLKALKVNHQVFKYLNDLDGNLKKDEDFLLSVMNINSQLICYLPRHLKRDDGFMQQIVIGKPQAETSLKNSTIKSIISLENLHLAPSTLDLQLEGLDQYDIMQLSEDFNELIKDKMSEEYNLKRYKLQDLCMGVKQECSVDADTQQNRSDKQLSIILKNIMKQWKEGKNLDHKEKNLHLLADIATRCRPTWLEGAVRIYFELGSGSPRAKLLTLAQVYKEEAILQFVQRGDQWHALSKIRREYGANLGLNVDLVEHDVYGAREDIPTEWNIKALWDAPSLLQSVHTALCSKDYDPSIYEFLVEIAELKNIENPGVYVANHYYDEEDLLIKSHAVHEMLLHIGVLKAS